MKALTVLLLALASVATAHYDFEALVYNGNQTASWYYVRQWNNYVTLDPVTDVTSTDIRCNVGASTVSAPGTLTVSAGSQLGWYVTPAIYHAGPLLAYMAKVPSGKTAATWDGSGTVWFKIYQDGQPSGMGTSNLQWSNYNKAQVSFTIPSSTPPGDYLFRVEQIGLHVAQTSGAAQFFLSCGQITVTGSGKGTPGPLVAFPGAYKATDPGILINIYYPYVTNYVNPGPAVWSG